MKELILSAMAQVGMAWWVEVKTELPTCTYYFGPFSSSNDAVGHQSGYLDDLRQEGAQNIHVEVKRCRPTNLTISD